MGRSGSQQGMDSEVHREANLKKWRRPPFRFGEVALEIEFAQEVNESARLPLKLGLGIAACVFVAELVVGDSLSKIASTDLAARVTVFARFTGIAFVVVLLGMAFLCRQISSEAIAMTGCTVCSLMLCFSNTYRVSKAFGSDLHLAALQGCGADICLDDTAMLLLLTGVVIGTMIFVSVRSCFSWVLVIGTSLLYALSSFTGWGPMPVADHAVYGCLYATLTAGIWVGCLWNEMERRRRWCENKLVLIEAELERRENELQLSRLREIAEHAAALGQLDDGGNTPKKDGGAAMQRVRTEEESAGLRVPTPAEAAACGAFGFSAKELRQAHEGQRPAAGDFPAEPNAVLAAAMAGRRADAKAVRRMAERIRDPNYGLREFFGDSVKAFPEFDLFFQPGAGGEMSSGLSALVEYQRTVGALFAVYWLLRLDIDGKQGFSYGCDERWNSLTEPQGHDSAKRAAFFSKMDWKVVEDMVALSVGKDVARIEAMLCLTAFHDVMKVSSLCPTVSPAHAPFGDYKAGEVVSDHDLALAYVLEHYPHLMPSFALLPESLRQVVLFTQHKMQFNHGWFVQAEGPPGALVSALKRVMASANEGDLAFYFFHWVTDLSGAEGTPLGGAEKFALKFPSAVLSSFLWSVPYLQRLTAETEVEVVENYLKERFRTALPKERAPTGHGAVARMRLAVMAQQGAEHAMKAWDAAAPHVQGVLSREMAATGIQGQVFRDAPAIGPAFLLYYGPAVLQRCTRSRDMHTALTALAAVYCAGRQLFRSDPAKLGETVTLEVSALKAMDIAGAVSSGGAKEPRVWVLVRRNDREGALMCHGAAGMNALIRTGETFVFVDLQFDVEFARTDIEDKDHPGYTTDSLIPLSEECRVNV